MTPEEALDYIKQSSSEKSMGMKIELQARLDITQVISAGYFDPLLANIIDACEARADLLRTAAQVLAEHYE